MEFESLPQEACYEKVRRWLQELFGEMVAAPQDKPYFLLSVGSTTTIINVSPWGDNDSVINAKAPVAYNSGLNFDLLYFLLKQNSSYGFGAFSVDESGTIYFQHTIVGSWCDKEELKASVVSVMTTADEFDDFIVNRWGGKRLVDYAQQ